MWISYTCTRIYRVNEKQMNTKRAIYVVEYLVYVFNNFPKSIIAILREHSSSTIDHWPDPIEVKSKLNICNASNMRYVK